MGMSFTYEKEAKADSIAHQVVEEPSTGLSIEETADNSLMVFNDVENTSISKDKFLGITINAIQNKSTFVDPYIFLQFSFINGMDERVLQFDMSSPKIERNSIYYTTSEEGYTCPNRFFADSSSYFFLIKEGFFGTIYIDLSDYFNADFTIDSFKIFSDGHNHWNSYELIEVFLCEDTYGYGKTELVDLESLTFDSDFIVQDQSLVYEKQIIKKNTTLLRKVIKAHVIQSRFTMLNVSNSNTSSASELSICLNKNYAIRDALIININNILESNLYFKIILVDENNGEVSLDVSSEKTYSYSKSDDMAINLNCDGEYIILPPSHINGTLLISYSNFTTKPTQIKEIKLQFKNAFECEIGKIIDAQDSLTGNYKTLVNPFELNEDELDISNPSSGSTINSQTSNVIFRTNEESIYKINEDCNLNHGMIEHQVIGDYVKFSITANNGYMIDKVYANNCLVNIVDNEFQAPFTEDIDIKVLFKEARIYCFVDNQANALVYYETFWGDIVFHVIFRKGFTAKLVNFNGNRITLNDDNTYFVSGNLPKYEFEIFTREIIVSINYIDEENSRYGECLHEIKNGKLYLIFKPDEGYILQYFVLNDKRIDFSGSIYSLNADKDVSVEIKFFKK
jgi:hypothetical protein